MFIKKAQCILFYLLLFNSALLFATTTDTCDPCYDVWDCRKWSLNLGGQYTWMSLLTPPTYAGNTGGVHGELIYQMARGFFGSLRSVYNAGELKNAIGHSNDFEWYGEFVGGYCFVLTPCWTMTPYIGLGFDSLHDNRAAYSTFSPIQLRYQTCYAVLGAQTKYQRNRWSIGVKANCLPVCSQYLKIKGQTGAAWTMEKRVGVEIQLPFGFQLKERIWLEFAPYYRFLPIGKSTVLELPDRNLNQWGAFASFNFFL